MRISVAEYSTRAPVYSQRNAVDWPTVIRSGRHPPPLYAGEVRYASVITLCVLATVTAGCASASASGAGSGAGSAPKGSLPVVKACLRATHLAATPLQRNTTLLDSLHPRPVSLLWIRNGPGALIALYATDTDAVKIFSWSTHNAAGAAARQRAHPLVDHASANASATSPNREMCLRSRR